MKSQNRILSSKYLTIVIAVFLLLLQFSCKEKEEGCMDITAVNWDAAADKPCEDCCTYPSLTVSYEHNLGDTIVLYDSIYVDDFDNDFLITGLRFYLSDFTLFSDNTEYRPTDSLAVELFSNNGVEVNLEDNFALVSKFTSNSTIGTFLNTDLTIDSLGFSLGLNSLANTVNPTSVTVGKPLAIDSDSMFQSALEGYIFAKIGIVTDTMTMDTTVYRIIGNDNLVNMRFVWEKDLVRGENVVIPIKLDYRQWFTGINFATDTYDIIEEKFVENLANAFFIDD